MTDFLTIKRAAMDGAELPEKVTKQSAGCADLEAAHTKELEEQRIIPFTVSTRQVDRMDDVIEPLGGDFEAYKANPVVLWAHDSRSLPIGKGLNVRADENDVRMDKRFTTKEENPFGAATYELIKGGYLNAASIGFRIFEYAWNKERGPLAMDIKRWELVESSVVPIPANPGALVGARAAGIDTAPIAEWASKLLDELPAEERNPIIERAWKAARGKETYYSIPKELAEEAAALAVLKSKGWDITINKQADEATNEEEVAPYVRLLAMEGTK